MGKYKGMLEGRPEFFVRALLNEQVKQGNPENVSVFERNIQATKKDGGFNYEQTEQKTWFWNQVVTFEKYNLLFVEPVRMCCFDIVENLYYDDIIDYRPDEDCSFVGTNGVYKHAISLAADKEFDSLTTSFDVKFSDCIDKIDKLNEKLSELKKEKKNETKAFFENLGIEL